jgi:hypothetical protein
MKQQQKKLIKLPEILIARKKTMKMTLKNCGKKKSSKKRLPITIFNIKNSLNSLRQTAHRHLIVSNRNGLIFCCAQWKKHKYELPNQIYLHRLHTVTGEVLQRKVNGQRPIFCLVPSTLLVLRPDKEKTSA